jgi:hypothetical protein
VRQCHHYARAIDGSVHRRRRRRRPRSVTGGGWWRGARAGGRARGAGRPIYRRSAREIELRSAPARAGAGLGRPDGAVPCRPAVRPPIGRAVVAGPAAGRDRSMDDLTHLSLSVPRRDGGTETGGTGRRASPIHPICRLETDGRWGHGRIDLSMDEALKHRQGQRRTEAERPTARAG